MPITDTKKCYGVELQKTGFRHCESLQTIGHPPPLSLPAGEECAQDNTTQIMIFWYSICHTIFHRLDVFTNTESSSFPLEPLMGHNSEAFSNPPKSHLCCS